jgi:hypothetical protein
MMKESEKMVQDTQDRLAAAVADLRALVVRIYPLRNHDLTPIPDRSMLKPTQNNSKALMNSMPLKLRCLKATFRHCAEGTCECRYVTARLTVSLTFHESSLGFGE